MPLVEQELLTLFYRLFVVFVLLNLLVLCEMFCGSLLVFWSLYCLYFFDLRLLITYVDIFQHFVRAGLHVNVYICSGSSNHSVFVLLSFFVLSLCCLYFFDLRILITPFVYSNSSSEMPYLFAMCMYPRCTVCEFMATEIGWKYYELQNIMPKNLHQVICHILFFSLSWYVHFKSKENKRTHPQSLFCVLFIAFNQMKQHVLNNNNFMKEVPKRGKHLSCYLNVCQY